MKSKRSLSALRTYEADESKPLTRRRVESVRRLTQRLELVIAQIAELETQIKELAAAKFSPLTELCGVNLLTAGTLAGILGPGRRFESDAALASFAGVAPLESSSAGLVRHGLNRGGHRRLNAVVYRIALTQTHYSPEARAYLARRTSCSSHN